MIVWRNWTSVISRFFLVSLRFRRGASILRFLSSGCVRLKARPEPKTGLKVEKTLLLSRLLLLNETLRSAPVGIAWSTPKFQMSSFSLIAAPPEKRLVPLVSAERLLSCANRKGS